MNTKFDPWWKQLFNAIPFFLALILLVTALSLMPGQEGKTAAAQAPTPEPTTVVQRTVSVSGTGMVEVEPDTAYIILGVQTDAETAVEALSENNEKMDSLINALTSAGIARADIQTSNIQLYPRYENPPQPQPGQAASQPELVGYTASNTVQVRVRNIDNVGQILDSAVTAGSNQIQGIRFDVANQSQVLDQARQAAVQDALRKAEQLADLTNARLGLVLTISEYSRYPQPFEAPAAMGMAQAQDARSVPISPGTQTIVVDVQVTWELQP